MARRDPWLFVGLLGFFGLLLLALFGERVAPPVRDGLRAGRCVAASCPVPTDVRLIDVVWNDTTGPMLI